MTLRWLGVAALAACGTKDAPAAKPCVRGATVEARVVDNDAAYMRALYARIGAEGKDGIPTDPAAISAGLRADVDMWRVDVETVDGVPRERLSETDYFVVAPDRAKLEGYLATFSPVPSDREIRLEFAEANHWRTYYVMKAPMIDTSSIATVELGTNPVTERPILTFGLTAEGKRAFAAGTKAAIGKKLAMLIDGNVMIAPVVNDEIKGGQFSIDMPTTGAARAMLARLACVK